MTTVDNLRHWLTTPGLFPDPGEVELRETHISLVALTPCHVYKFRKPVGFDFLDFRTREARYVDCWNEVLLNRRLTDDVYLEVVPLFLCDGRPHLGASPRSLSPQRHGLRPTSPAAPASPAVPVDWCVKMRRLPDESSLESKLARGEVTEETLRQLMGRMRTFFRAARPLGADRAAPYAEAFRASLLGNFAVLERFAEAGAIDALQVRALRSRQLQLFTALRPLLEARLIHGWVRECHGDLRADHVYLLGEKTEPERDPARSVQVIDCVEFRREFREVDILDECCFFAMDLERLGHPDLARAWLEIYRAEMRDESPPALAALFLSYRAAVRSKVTALQGEPRSGVEQRESFDAAGRLQEISLAALSAHSPTLLLVMVGLSGTGKSTVARQLAEAIGATRIASDEVRKEEGTEAGDNEGRGVGLESVSESLYTERSIQNVYAELLRRGEPLLKAGTSVILDATFLRRRDRADAMALARRCGVEIRFVRMRCDDQVVRRRLIERQQAGTDPSDADVSVYERQRSKFEEITLEELGRTVEVDSEAGLSRFLPQIVSRQEVV